MAEAVNLYDLSRKERGAILANEHTVEQSYGGWRVPSQSGNGTYVVVIDDGTETCTCPDYEHRETKCKHIHAVEFTKEYKITDDGDLQVTETVTKTYSQNWEAYNGAQRSEYRVFMELLADLCGRIDTPQQDTGRPSKPLADMVFACALKVYSGFSLRRFESLMEVAQERGHIREACCYSTVSNYMNKPEVAELLHDLIAISSAPLSAVETAFAVDSSGFSTSRFGRYFDYKHGQENKYRKWVKAHLCCGVETNVVTAVTLTEGKAGDSPEFGPLVERTAEVFGVKEVSADKAYSSRANHDLVADLGGEAYIPFKQNATGRAKGSPAWKKMYHRFQLGNDEFREHYHKRSNVETVFHMLKTKFGDSVNAKTECAQFNETLLKILCHNVVVVIHELRESDIDPGFLADDLDTASELVS
jgi:transposase